MSSIPYFIRNHLESRKDDNDNELFADIEKNNGSASSLSEVESTANRKKKNSQDMHLKRDESSDTLYFKPKKVYQREREDKSHLTLVRVYSENESSNFDNETGIRLYDDLKYRPIRASLGNKSESSSNRYSDDSSDGGISGSGNAWQNTGLKTIDRQISKSKRQSRRYSVGDMNSNNGMHSSYVCNDMCDEYVPDLDYEDVVRKWQTHQEYELRGTSSHASILRDQLSKNNYNLSRCSSSSAIWNSSSGEHNSGTMRTEYPDRDSQRRLLSPGIISRGRQESFLRNSSISPAESFICQSSHAQVEPIPLPNARRITALPSTLELGTTESEDNGAQRRNHSGSIIEHAPIDFSRNNNTNNQNIHNNSSSGNNYHSLKSLPSFTTRWKSSLPGSYDSASSSITYMPESTLTIMQELKMSPDEILELINSLPSNFLSLPYSQRKRVLIDLMPNKDYKLVMALTKKYMLTSSNSNASLAKNSVRSTQGSTASQFLNSFSPSVSSIASMNTGIMSRPDDKGKQIMGHKLGKIIGFGAWGMIRECFDSQYGTCRAIKIVRFKSNRKVKEQVIQEVSVWKDLKHDGILPLLDWKLDDDYAMYCLTKRVYDGTLYDVVLTWDTLDKTKINVYERSKSIVQLGLQAASALKYMHSQFIVHGDIKLENCLVVKTEDQVNKWRVLLCDFGMSCHFASENSTYRQRPTASGTTTKRRLSEQESSERSPSKANFTVGSLETNASSFMESTIASTEVQKPIQTKRTTLENEQSIYHLSSLSKNLKNRRISKNEGTMGISSIPRKYGPSLTSTRFTSKSSASLSDASSVKISQPPLSLDTAEIWRPESNIDHDSPAGPDPHSHIGSLPYAAPELLEPKPPPLTSSADVWALGVMLYTMLAGKLPFKHDYEPRLRAIIASGRYDPAPLSLISSSSGIFSSLGADIKYTNFKELANAISGCLMVDTEARWDMNKVYDTLQDNLEKIN